MFKCITKWKNVTFKKKQKCYFLFYTLEQWIFTLLPLLKDFFLKLKLFVIWNLMSLLACTKQIPEFQIPSLHGFEKYICGHILGINSPNMLKVLIMPPFEEEGVYCFAHMLVCPSVGRRSIDKPCLINN